MKLSKLEKEIEKLKIDEGSKQAFLKLMDFKIENDMEKAITRLESSIGSLNSKIDASNSKIDNIKWFIGGVVALAAALACLFKIF